MNHSDIIRAFGFHLPQGYWPESIYLFAPVYRLEHRDREWILKRTQRPLARGQAVAAWAHAVAAKGIRLVYPAQGFGENPRAFAVRSSEEEVWVVYPYIVGDRYAGSLTQIRSAGSLLGEIHAVPIQDRFSLKTSETVVAVDAADIDEDIAGIRQHVRRVFPDIAKEIEGTLAENAEKYLRDALPRMIGTRLPLAVCSWDYKASNLVYPRDDSPVLVDVDNAGYIPRLYDLAIAALLFHNEGQGPGRLFTVQEWSVFLEGYIQHVRWTEEEKRVWQDVLLCAWIDEGLWLLRNDQEGWGHPHQSQMLLSLLTTDLSNFTLSLKGKCLDADASRRAV